MKSGLDRIAAHLQEGKLEEARRALVSVSTTDENRADVLYLRGYLHELSYERGEAVRAYEEVLTIDSDHVETLFRLAMLADMMGDDETAMRCFERSIARGPAPVNALINLAVLYEEEGRFTDAERCLRSVLEGEPNHIRARHFLKSVLSSRTMYVDELVQRERDQQSALLDIPITDFELSVRSRNCLRQMNIRSLGDLLRTSEAELLSYKNFGETSLSEIKALLNQKGLSLGQGAKPVERPLRSASILPSTDSVANLNKPISELELSVRSRKCLQWLGVSTLGDLAMRTEAELVSIKNFGQTSLAEIKRQMALYGLSFRLPA